MAHRQPFLLNNLSTLIIVKVRVEFFVNGRTQWGQARDRNLAMTDFSTSNFQLMHQQRSSSQAANRLLRCCQGPGTASAVRESLEK